MRGRKRSGPWPPRGTADTFPDTRGADTEIDVESDAALRALVRLLASQAAHEVFEQTVRDLESGRSVDEGCE
jgi:hypothetical protein